MLCIHDLWAIHILQHIILSRETIPISHGTIYIRVGWVSQSKCELGYLILTSSFNILQPLGNAEKGITFSIFPSFAKQGIKWTPHKWPQWFSVPYFVRLIKQASSSCQARTVPSQDMRPKIGLNFYEHKQTCVCIFCFLCALRAVLWSNCYVYIEGE